MLNLDRNSVFLNNMIPFLQVAPIVDNTAPNGSASASNDLVTINFSDCIIWGHGSNAFWNRDSPWPCAFTSVIYSDLQNEKGITATGYSGSNNIDIDPLFVTGPRGSHYLSQVSAGQRLNSPCLDLTHEAASVFSTQKMTTRTDGIFDDDKVDLGYHYQPHLIFDLRLDSPKGEYVTGDNLKLLLDIEEVPPARNVDVYMIIIDPLTMIYYGMSWTKNFAVTFPNILFPGNLSLSDILLVNVTIPSQKPPIGLPGDHMFAIAAFKAGQGELISNIETLSFMVK